MKTEEDYYNLLGMMGVILQHIGGKVEITYEELASTKFSDKEFVHQFDAARNLFVFELKDVREVVQ